VGTSVVNLKQWLAAHQQLLTQRLSVWTLKRVLKAAGFRFKRVRKSLKDLQDEVLMAFFHQEMEALQAAHQAGELSLWYYDESGFGLNPAGLYAWQAPEAGIHLPAQRGQGFTVAGFLSASHELQAYSYSGPTSTEAFIGFVEDWLKQHPPTKKTVLVLDNASFHTSAAVISKRAEWVKQKLYLQYLPAYGSELNRIEVLWHRVKHEWLTLTDYASGPVLRGAVEAILTQYGSKYTITFA
jgi:transposase